LRCETLSAELTLASLDGVLGRLEVDSVQGAILLDRLDLLARPDEQVNPLG